MAKLLGRAPNQVPTNADLGTMAFQDREGINVNNAIVANLVVTGATTVNTPFAVANSSSNVAYYASNGNVGIGTSTPTAKLQVLGNTAYFGAFNTTGGTTVFVDSPTAQTASITYRQGGGNAVELGTRKSNNSVLTIRESASGAERVTFVANSTSGAIAINNAAPSTGHVMSVVGNTYFDNERMFLYSVTANSGPFIQFYTANTSSFEALRFLHPGGNTAFDAGYDTGASAYYINRFDTAGAYVDRSFFIGRANGNVGIANVTPDAKLAVTGTANISGNVTFGGTSFVVTNVANTSFVANNTTGDFKIYRDSIGGGQYLSITEGSSGHIITGVSTNINQKPIVLNATAGGNTAYDFGVSLQVEGSTKLAVNATGVTVYTNLQSTSGNTALGNTTVTGNLTVTGTTTYVNTTNLNVGDNIITLNADVSGAPSENAGIEINRGTSTNTSFYWDETNDRWTADGGNSSNAMFVVVSNSYIRTIFTDVNSGLFERWGTIASPSTFAEFSIAGGVTKFDTKNRDYLIANGSVNTAIFAANGNIGLGNTAPAQKLTIGGTTKITTGDLFIDNGWLYLSNGANTTPSIVKHSGNTSVAVRMDIPNLGGNSTIAAGGFWNGLHLSGPEGIANSTGGTTFSRTSLFYSYTSNNNPSDLYFNIWNGNNGGVGGVGVGARIYAISGVDGLSRGIDIAANGNIGISNTTPQHKLVISDNTNSYLGTVVIHNANTSGAAAEAKIHFLANGYTTYYGQSPSGFGFLTSSTGSAINVYGGTNAGTVLGANGAANVMYLVANGNVGIGTSTPADKLSVVGTINATGSISANNLRRYVTTRTLSTTVNDTVEIGTIQSSPGGAHNLLIAIQVTDSNFSVAKQYQITTPYNSTSGATYRRVLPHYDTGTWGGQDFELEAYHNADVIGFRLRRTAGTVAGIAEILIDDLAISDGTDLFTPSTTTATGVAAVTDIFPGNRVLNTNINHTTPNTFIVVANTTVNAITSNNTITAFNLPVSFGSYTALGSSAFVNIGLTTSATTANQVLSTYSATAFRTAKFIVQVTSGSAYQATEITLIHDGTTVYKSEYGQVFSGAILATFDADINSGNVRLLTTPTNAVTVYKGLATQIVI